MGTRRVLLPGRIATARRHPDAEAQLVKARGLQRGNRIQLCLALGASFGAAPAASTM
jgi:hypothetical protein